MYKIDEEYIPTDDDFLRLGCRHIGKVSSINNVNGKIYSIGFCSDCLRLLNKVEIRQQNGTQMNL